MSVASVNNGSLQLSELVISNEKYSAASGYVASQSTFTSSNTSTSLNSNTISAVSQVISPSFQLSLGGSTTSKPALSTNSANNCVISTVSNSGLTLSSSSGNATFTPGASGVSVNNGITATGNITTEANMSCVDIAVSGELSTPLVGIYNTTTDTDFINLTCPNSNILAIGNGSGANASNGELLCNSIEASGIITCTTTGGVTAPTVALYLNETTTYVDLGCSASNELTVGQSQPNGTINCGTVNATSYAGGIASLFVESVEVPEIFTGTSVPYTYVIPNFVGSDTTAYTISSNLQTDTAPGSQTTFFVWSVSYNSATATDTTVNVLVSNLSPATVGASTYNISIMAMN